jgi:hypothetical protein
VLVLLMLTACSEDGERAKPDASCADRAADATSGAADPALMWSHHIADVQGPTHYNVSLGFHGRYVFSGAPDGGGTMFAVDEGPSPLWKTVLSGQFLVAAAATDDIFYGVWTNGGVDGAVHRFRAADATPVWTYDPALQGFTFPDIGGLLMGGNSPVATTPDGRILAVAANSEDKLAILFFGVESSTPVGVYRGDEAASVLGTLWLKLTPDGRECLYQADARFHRVDVATQQLVASVPMPDVRAVSPDGTVLVRGSTNLLRAYRRVADSYDEQILVGYPQSIAEGTVFPEASAVAADNDTVVAVWSHEDQRQLTVTAFSLSCGSSPMWAYTLPKSSGGLQDLAAAVEISDDSEWIAIGTWGGEDNSHPEFLLFHSADPSEPRFTFDTPGSVLALDMTADGSLIAAGTKATHTNVVGSGGGVFVVSTVR